MTTATTDQGPAGARSDCDCTPALFDALSLAQVDWLARVFGKESRFLPMLIARQEMAGQVDILKPPGGVTNSFRVVRIGETTFDLEGHATDLDGRVVARATSVVALTDARTSRRARIPNWLQRTLKKGPR